MSQTQAFNIVACTFGTVAIEGCRRMELHEGSEPLRIEGDGDVWPRLIAATGGSVQWALEFSSIDAAAAAQSRMFGAPATLTVVADDASTGDPGLTVALDNAVVTGRDTAMGHHRAAVHRLRGVAFSDDGVTNPVS